MIHEFANGARRGFNSVDIGKMAPATLMVSDILMLIVCGQTHIVEKFAA